MNRQIKIERKTKETRVSLDLNLDGSGRSDLQTGLPFLEHMLDLFSRHGFFDLTIRAEGDLEVDAHHLVEDIGLCLGKGFYDALGDKKGIGRYGNFTVPMDDALVTAATDLSGRPYLYYELQLPEGQLGSIDTGLFREFWQAFVNEGRLNLHLLMSHGHNRHHMIEASFKAAARALNQASSLIEGYEELLSTKDYLE